VKLGLAYIDRNRCLPWAGQSDCIVCEEHCRREQGDRAQGGENAPRRAGSGKMFKKPYIDEDLCVGCGICETKCR